MAQKAIVRYFRNLEGNEDFTFHCFRKSSTRYIVYGRQAGRPCKELEKMLANVELSVIDQYKILSYSYDKENTCLCLSLEKIIDECQKNATNNIRSEAAINCRHEEAPGDTTHRRLRKTVTPSTRLRSISDCSIFGAVPILSYETAMNKYYVEGNYKVVLEIYQAACKAGLQPSPAMVKTRDVVLTFIK